MTDEEKASAWRCGDADHEDDGVMRYLSVCSGIEAASVAWRPLGWKPVAFAEVEPFPSAVLAHHYPNVPNLGDMTRFKEWPDADVDVLVGGTPCQSFSVAGLRRGLADPRGNLALTFLAIAEKYQPQWVLWENVPGVISDKTGALQSFLTGLEELGYISDIDILDAQFFGVPQRRRRVFVCAQRRDVLLKTKTTSSALVIAQALQEILHGILGEAFTRCVSERDDSDTARLSSDGVSRRIRLFGLDGETEDFWPMLQQNLDAELERCRQEQRSSDAPPGEKAEDSTAEGRLTDSETGVPFLPTDQSWKEALDGVCEAVKSFTTSTSTNSITNRQTYTYSKAVLSIAKLIAHSNPLSPPWWSAASSSLIALKECIAYARQTNSDLFGDVERFSDWLDFIREAESAADAIGSIGVENSGEVSPVSEGLRWHPAPRREAGANVAALTARGVGTCGADDNQAQAGHLIPQVAQTLRARDGAKRVDSDCTDTLVVTVYGGPATHALTAEGFDASEDGTGRGTPVVAFQDRFRGDDGRGYSRPPSVSQGQCGALETVKPWNVADGMAVRRLTPVECERLQGFPDDFTAIPWRGKPAGACPDGLRYKALGNSMAVPVMRWIGERVAWVDKEAEAVP